MRIARSLAAALVAGLAGAALAAPGLPAGKVAYGGQDYEVTLYPAKVEYIFTPDVAGTMILLDGRRDGPMTSGHPVGKLVVRRADKRPMPGNDARAALLIAHRFCAAEERGWLSGGPQVITPAARAVYENGVWGVFNLCR